MEWKLKDLKNKKTKNNQAQAAILAEVEKVEAIVKNRKLRYDLTLRDIEKEQKRQAKAREEALLAADIALNKQREEE